VIGLPFTIWLETWLLRLAMAFVAGIVLVTGTATVAGSIGFGPGVVVVAAAGLGWLVAATLVVRSSRDRLKTGWSWPPPWGWPASALLALTALNVFTSAGYAFKTPIADWDVVKVWLPKAEILDGRGFQGLATSVYPDYPPLWPLHLYLAGVDAPWVKLLPAAYLLATLVIAFEYVRPRAGPTFAAASALAISGVPYLWLPYGVNDLMSEIPTMALVTASTVLLATYVETPSARCAALTALTAVGVVWVRPEGVLHGLLIAAILVAAGIARRRGPEAVVSALSIVAAYVFWRAIVAFVIHSEVEIQPKLSALTPPVVLSTVAEIVRYAAANVGNPYLFGPALVAATLIVLGRAGWRAYGVVTLVLLIDLAGVVAVYVSLPSTDVGQPLIWWLTTGFKRMVMHFVPLLYIAGAMALSVWWRQTGTQRGQRSRLPGGLAELGTIGLALVGIAVAAFAAYQLGGPKSYDLSLMIPSHVYGPAVDYASAGTMSVKMDGASNSQVIFYLQNTGRRIPPLDNITGTFTQFTANVVVDGPPATVGHFSVSVDGTDIADRTVAAGSGPAAIRGRIPIGARLLQLTVSQNGAGSATFSWMQPSVQRATAWWAVEIFLAAAAACVIVAWAVWAIRSLRAALAPTFRLAGTRLAPAALLAAAAVQQAEATGALLIPSWSFAARLLTHF
jgi:hypothetical protein